MNISIRMLDSNRSISQKIINGIIGRINKAVSRSKKPILDSLRTEVVEWLEESQVIRDLRGSGSLNAEVGLPPGQASSAAHAIVNAVVGSLDLHFSLFDKRFNGKLSIGIQPLDFNNLLNLGGATILTEKGKQLDWLDWLLRSGNRIIIRDYDIEYGNYGGRSRSGKGAIMVKKSGNAAWRMPAQYSGVDNDNFITRAFEGKESDISQIISKQIKSKI